MSDHFISMSSSNKYYLQALGIDLYQLRQPSQIDESCSEKTVADDPIANIKRQLKSKSQTSNKSIPEVTVAENNAKFVMSMSDIEQSQLVCDICLLLNVDVKMIKQISDCCFQLGSVQWHFCRQDQAVSFCDNKLTSGMLDTFRDGHKKAQLYKCLTPLLN